LNLKLDLASIQALYTQDYYSNSTGVSKTTGYPDYQAMEPALRKSFREKLTRIKRLKSAGMLLDVGCAFGFFLDEAKDSFDAYGIELSPFAAAFAHAELDLNVFVGTFTTAGIEEATFDVITLWDTLEHLSSPRKALQEAARLLKTGGVLALQTGDVASLCAKFSGMRWHLYNLPEHLFFFSKDTCTRILQATGFKVIWCSYDTNYYSLSHLLDRLARMAGLRAMPENGLLDQVVLPVNLFDIITFYAVKI
jgi:SAM-dependent methyltransferase